MFVIAIMILMVSLIALTFSNYFNNKQEGYEYSGIVRILAVVGFIFALGLGFSTLVRIVPAGHVGVVDLWGKVDEQVRNPGLNLVNPFVDLVIMDVQTQELKETMEVPSKEGLTMQVDMSILYRLNPDKASSIYKTIGSDYDEVVVVPQFRTSTKC